MKNENLISPTYPHQRILLIDIIRGFALLGILLVNAPSLNSPIWTETTEFAFQNNTWDSIVTNFIFLFATNKFYPIFSFLFGLSAIIFMENAAQKGLKPQPLFIRRLGILFFFGLIHVVFVWWGDILITYALLGMLLALFYRASSRLLLATALFLLFLLMAIDVGLAYEDWLSSNNLEEEVLEGSTEQSDILEEEEEMDFTYRDGSFVEIIKKRLEDYYDVFLWGLITPDDKNDFAMYLSYYLHILAIFLLGAWTQKRKILQNLEQNWPLIKKIGAYAIFIAFVTNILGAHYDFFDEALYALQGLSLGIVYLFLIIALYRQAAWKKRLAPLASIGKMSLTVYLGGNLLLSLIFYSYGLGLYGAMGPGTQLWITLAIYFGFLGFSVMWLKYYRFGPLEYLWRRLTYNKIF